MVHETGRGLCGQATKNIYYICSFGGCGSKMLTNFLQQFGKVVHIHNRYPPKVLSVIRLKSENDGSFSTIPICNESLSKVHVIYIFRDPTEAQVSRWGINHFMNIQVPNLSRYVKILANPKKYIKYNQNLLKYDKFHQNYMKAPRSKNYNIYAINYHKLFTSENIKHLCNKLKLPPGAETKFPHRKESSQKKWKEYRADLDKLNMSLKLKIKNSPFMQII